MEYYKNLFTVEWIGGTINAAIVKKLEKASIAYMVDYFGQLYADINRDGKMVHLDADKISGNIYGVYARIL